MTVKVTVTLQLRVESHLGDYPILTVSGLRVHSSESSRGPGIHHLELFGVQVIQQVVIGFNPGALYGRPELGGRGSDILMANRSTLQFPVPEPPVQQRHRVMPEHPEHPPNAGRRERTEVAAVVYHDVRVVFYSQIPNVICENFLRRQHVVQGGGFVAALVYVEERGAGDVPLLELPFGVSPHFGQIPRAVQDAHFPPSRYCVREPFSADQRSSLKRHGGSGRGECRLGYGAGPLPRVEPGSRCKGNSSREKSARPPSVHSFIYPEAVYINIKH